MSFSNLIWKIFDRYFRSLEKKKIKKIENKCSTLEFLPLPDVKRMVKDMMPLNNFKPASTKRKHRKKSNSKNPLKNTINVTDRFKLIALIDDICQNSQLETLANLINTKTNKNNS